MNEHDKYFCEWLTRISTELRSLHDTARATPGADYIARYAMQAHNDLLAFFDENRDDVEPPFTIEGAFID